MNQNTKPSGPSAASPSAQDNPWSFNLARVAGIPIRLHITFFVLLAWLFLVFSRQPGPDRWYGLLYVIGIFACVLLHELGHSIIAQRYGISVSEIVLYPIGGVARMEKMPKPREELWIALAGPAVNVVIAVAIYLWLQVNGAWVPWEQVALEEKNWWQQLMATNIFLAAFNMIPAFPMDGGRVLRSILAMRMNEVHATEVSAAIGQMLAFVMGFFALFSGHLLLLFIAFFVFIGAGQEAAMYRGRALAEGLKVREAMITDFRTLPVGATLKDAANLLLETTQQDFPVMNGEEVLGVLSRQALLRGLAIEGPTGYVTGSMDRDFLSATPETDLQEIAASMQLGQRPVILVLSEGRLRGMVTQENLAELFIVRQLLQRKGERG